METTFFLWKLINYMRPIGCFSYNFAFKPAGPWHISTLFVFDISGITVNHSPFYGLDSTMLLL